MNKILRLFPIALCAVVLLATSACTTSTTTAVKAALENPNNEAKAVQDSVAGAASLVLANNPTYANEFSSVANILVATAASNPSTLTAADLTGAVSKVKIDGKAIPANRAQQYSQLLITALGAFKNDFQVSFPTIDPPYVLFLDAAANGLLIATGGQTVTLPVIPWPKPTPTPAPVVAPAPAPVTAPTPTPTPTPVPTS
jgi:hypothetical protein